MAYAASDPWQAFVDEGWARACKETGFTEESQCETVLVARALGKVTVSAAFAEMAKRREHDDLRNWIGQFMLEAVPARSRLVLLAAIAEFDPTTACIIYVWREDLTDEEDAILYAGFKGTMTFMVGKLAREPQCRAKAKALARG